MSRPEKLSENWLPLLEYAVRTGTSLSTVRRYIKSKKLAYRIDGGKYYVRCVEQPELAKFTESPSPNNEVAALRTELKRAKEEIAELKTLIAFYENG